MFLAIIKKLSTEKLTLSGKKKEISQIMYVLQSFGNQESKKSRA